MNNAQSQRLCAAEIGKFSDQDTGNYVSILSEDYNSDFGYFAHWTVNAGTVRTAFEGGLITGSDGNEIQCNTIEQNYGNLLKFQTRAPHTVTRTLDVRSNSAHRLSFDIILDQPIDPSTGDQITQTATISIEKPDGTVLASTVVNGGTNTTCIEFFETSVSLDFTPEQEQVILKMLVVPSYIPTHMRNQFFIDNLNLQVATEAAVAFFYDDKGKRIRKEVYSDSGFPNSPNTFITYYVRDASGNPMGIYKGGYGPAIRMQTTLKENPVYGASRLGILYRDYVNGRPWNGYTYQLTDHLGNVRAVIKKENTLVINGVTDYYPGGMPMPNRNNVDANGYRYGYQGEFAETDPETGKPAFQLRLYDPRINRWLSPDPMGQYFSPYMAMDNRPNMSVDPTGGCTVGVDCPEEFNWMDAGTFVLDEVAFNDDAVPWGTASITGGGNIDFSQASFWDWDRMNWNYTPSCGSMQEWKPSKAYEWKISDNILKSATYDALNGVVVTIQPLNPFHKHIYTLDGSTVERGSSELEAAFVDTVSNFIPYTKGTKGLRPLKKINAAQFSHLFKGTLAKLSPNARGYINKQIINDILIHNANNSIGSGSVVLTSVSQIKNTIDK